MKSKMTIKLPPATPADWRWREYKGYLSPAGDLVDCVVVGGVAVAAVNVRVTNLQTMEAA